MQQLTKQRILIAGSGPVGLYTAILLKRKYVNGIDVTIIDSRVDSYERPGIIAKQAVEIINASFKINDIPPIDVPDSQGIPANSVFIGDLQKSLLKHAKQYKVNIVSQSFDELIGKTVTTKDKNTLDCDLLIDCTGESRAITRFANQELGPNSIFKIEPIAENPIKNHFIAYVHMDKENSAGCTIQNPENRNPVLWASAMQNLRAQGWQEFAEPEIVTSRWDNGENGTSYCFYFEIPAAVAQGDVEQQEAYLKTLLQLKTGQSLKFTREDGRLKFLPFDVDPKIVLNPINITNYPIPVGICGDALMSPEYRLGTGVRNGILCANALVNSIAITPDRVLINEQRYNVEAQGVVQEHVKEVTRNYKAKKKALSHRDLLDAYSIYTKAYEELNDDSSQLTENAFRVETGLFDLAAKFKLSATEKFLAAIDKKKKGLYFEEDIQVAEKLFMNSLHIYQRYCPHMQESFGKFIGSESSKLCSNLAKIYFQIDNVSDAIHYAEKSLDLANKFDVTEMLHMDKIPKVLYDCYEKALLNCDEGHLVEKIELNEKLVQLASSIQKNPSVYLEKIQMLKQTIKQKQETLKSEINTLKDESSSFDSGQKTTNDGSSAHL